MKWKKLFLLAAILLILFFMYIFYTLCNTGSNGKIQQRDNNQSCTIIPLDNMQPQKSVPVSTRSFTSEELLEMMEKGAQGDLTNRQFDSILVEAQTGMKYHDYLSLTEEDKEKVAEALEPRR